jgi:hypothetical protein
MFFARTALSLIISTGLSSVSWAANGPPENRFVHGLYPFQVLSRMCAEPQVKEGRYFQGVFYEKGAFCAAPWPHAPYQPGGK